MRYIRGWGEKDFTKLLYVPGDMKGTRLHRAEHMPGKDPRKP